MGLVGTCYSLCASEPATGHRAAAVLAATIVAAAAEAHRCLDHLAAG